MTGKVFINNVYPRNIVKDNRQVKKMFKDNVQVWPAEIIYQNDLSDYMFGVIGNDSSGGVTSQNQANQDIQPAIPVEKGVKNIYNTLHATNRYMDKNSGDGTDYYGVGNGWAAHNGSKFAFCYNANQRRAALGYIDHTADGEELIFNFNHSYNTWFRKQPGESFIGGTCWYFECNNANITININAGHTPRFCVQYAGTFIRTYMVVNGNNNRITVNGTNHIVGTKNYNHNFDFNKWGQGGVGNTGDGFSNEKVYRACIKPDSGNVVIFNP